MPREVRVLQDDMEEVQGTAGEGEYPFIFVTDANDNN
jgi:hypothetical protein